MKPRSSRFALLGLLALRPMSGYQIRKTIERSISNFWNESFGQIYPTLADLVAEGLVREVPSKSRSRLFEPTQKGKKELERWLAEPIELSVSRNVFLLKLFLARFAGPEATRRIMAESPCAILLVTSTVSGHISQVFDAMGCGALDAVATPILASPNRAEGARRDKKAGI